MQWQKLVLNEQIMYCCEPHLYRRRNFTFVLFFSPLKVITAKGLLWWPSTSSASCTTTESKPAPSWTSSSDTLSIPLSFLTYPSEDPPNFILSSLNGTKVMSTTIFPLNFLFGVSLTFVSLSKSSVNSLFSYGLSSFRGTNCIPSLSCAPTCT